MILKGTGRQVPMGKRSGHGRAEGGSRDATGELGHWRELAMGNRESGRAALARKPPVAG
jgi:hypothetical protein